MPHWLVSVLQYALDVSNTLNLSVKAGWLVLAVLLMRLLLKRAPKWIRAALWGLVALRLLVPVSLPSSLSLQPSAALVPPELLQSQANGLQEQAWLDVAVNPVYRQVSVELEKTVGSVQIGLLFLNLIWWAGMAAMALYALGSWLRLHRRLRQAVRLQDNVFCSDRISGPFVLGLFRPRIYLPAGPEGQAFGHILAHERAHIARKDPWWKLLGFVLLSIHWFNPLLWCAYVLFCRDMELACDERVIRGMDRQQRADYSQALLDWGSKRSAAAVCPPAFGEGDVKRRVLAVLRYRKPALWSLIAALLAAVAVGVCFLTDPVSVPNPAVQAYIPGAPGILGSVDTAYFTRVSPDFAIGADRYGRAVFEDPHRAMQTLRTTHAEGIALIREQHGLQPLSRRTVGIYKLYGMQMTDGPAQGLEQARFAAKFLDIYENSFAKSVPDTNHPAPTAEAPGLSLNDVIMLSGKGYDLTWQDFGGFAWQEIGTGVYIRQYPINGLFSLSVGGPSPDRPPTYFYLQALDGTGDRIDIRDGGVTEFIAAHGSE